MLSKKLLWKGAWKKENLWFWKGFTTTHKFSKYDISLTIGNGEKITIGDCSWIPFPYKDGLLKPYSPIVHLNISVKELWNRTKKWDESKVISYFVDTKNVEEKLKIYIPRQLDW